MFLLPNYKFQTKNETSEGDARGTGEGRGHFQQNIISVSERITSGKSGPISTMAKGNNKPMRSIMDEVAEITG